MDLKGSFKELNIVSHIIMGTVEEVLARDLQKVEHDKVWVKVE